MLKHLLVRIIKSFFGDTRILFPAMSKEEKRRMKYKKREERRKERERRRQQKEKKVIQAPELGPLGNLLKSIIVANTFV